MFLGGGSERDTPTNAHRALHGKIPYYAYPPPNATEVLRYLGRVDTTRAFARGDYNVCFVGQIPRLLPLPYVPWALDLLMEEYGSKWMLQTQPNGCAKVWVETEGQCAILTERNKYMMFDVCGVFVARTGEEIRLLTDYQANLQQAGPIDARVPRHGAIIERLRAPQNPKPSMGAVPPHGAYGAQQRLVYPAPTAQPMHPHPNFAGYPGAHYGGYESGHNQQRHFSSTSGAQYHHTVPSVGRAAPPQYCHQGHQDNRLRPSIETIPPHRFDGEVASRETMEWTPGVHRGVTIVHPLCVVAAQPTLGDTCSQQIELPERQHADCWGCTVS